MADTKNTTLAQAQIGREFTCGGNTWRVTDVGSRVLVAIKVSEVNVITCDGNGVEKDNRILNREQAEAEGWFNGPSYAVAETVFDEDDMEAISWVAA